MRSNKPKEIVVVVNPYLGGHGKRFPNYIQFMHRHLEKEGGAATLGPHGSTYYAPVDLMGMSVPITQVDQVVEVQLVYRKTT